MSRITFFVFSLTLLIYLLVPIPPSIASFPPLPNSSKSGLAGDTVQIPNVAAYFSDNYRSFATNFYRGYFQQENRLPFGPLRLNHPPEYSFTAIKKHTDSTYLEEFVYPLRNSLYVNGFEPYYEDGKPKFWGSTKFIVGSFQYETKVTLRYYESSLPVRLVVWLGIIITVFSIWRLGRRVIFGERPVSNYS